MYLLIKGHKFKYECENLCRLFFPYSPVKVVDAPLEDNGKEILVSTLIKKKLCPKILPSDAICEEPKTTPISGGRESLQARIKTDTKEQEAFDMQTADLTASASLVSFDTETEDANSRTNLDLNTISYCYEVTITENSKKIEKSLFFNSVDEYRLTSLLFLALREFTGYVPSWGMLTGIHPVKLFGQLHGEMGEQAANVFFQSHYFVSTKKAELASRTWDNERTIINATQENDFALYISIPFCKTRCSYCSFVSHSVEQAKKLIEPYFALLLIEIRETARIVKELGLRLVSVYVGGGTPTTLTAQQLDQLLQTLRDEFDMLACTEITVEAGRPDTISREKLLALKRNAVSRISINPQSMSDDVLKLIGREHTAKDIIDTFKLAHQIGFDCINSDLIVGLPGDNYDGFLKTLKAVMDLGASNITVHALAIKRSAAIARVEHAYELHRDSANADRMMDTSISILTEAGFNPYYLYRQTRMAGNLENTGWCQEGKACAYNIYTMDETITTLACGAGAVSKIRDPYSHRIERIFNYKFPYEYIDRNDEMLRRKKGIGELYEQFRKRIH